MEQNKQKITFSFGRNWKNYAKTIDDSSISGAAKDIDEWLGDASIKGKRIIDVGSGSGIHSYVFFTKGAREVVSFDYDQYSVEATRQQWHRAGSPANWKVMQGSVLDADFIASLGQFDIVYSWGVLHHTGAMWKAIENSLSLIRPGGLYWISLYSKGPTYPYHLALKQKYNRANPLLKRYMEYKHHIWPLMKQRWKNRQNPLAWNERKERGMSTYYDIVDWLGGLPYEVASKEEVTALCEKHGMQPLRIKVIGEGGCDIYLFKKS